MTTLAYKVLVVDDEPQIRRLLRITLERGNYNVVLAADAREAMRMRSEEHTSELQSLVGISYAVFCLDRKSVV